MSVRGTVVGALVVAGLVGSGCGDPIAEHLESTGKQPYSEEDDVTDAAEKEDPRAAFVADVRHVCEGMGSAVSSLHDPAYVSAAVQMMRTVERTLRQGADRLGLLEAPDAAAAMALAAAQGHLRASADAAAATADAGAAGDGPTAGAQLDAALFSLAAADGALADAGVPDCGL